MGLDSEIDRMFQTLLKRSISICRLSVLFILQSQPHTGVFYTALMIRWVVDVPQYPSRLSSLQGHGSAC